MMQCGPRRKWLFALPLAAIGAAHVYFFLLPARRQIDELRRDLEVGRAYVSRDADLKKSIAKVEAMLADTNEYVNAWKDPTAHPGDISLLFGEINRRAKAAGTTLDSFEPQTSVDFQSLRRVPLRIAVRGSFAQVHAMLRSLEELPNTIWVENLKLEGSQENDKLLKAEITLAIFTALPDISDYVKAADNR